MSSIAIASPGGSAPARRPAVRLTARGRLLLFAVFLTLAVAALVLGGTSVATQEAGTPEPTRVVMVHEGDTLWSVAAGIADEDEDVREVMRHIERLNALDSPVLYAGQRLRLPDERVG